MARWTTPAAYRARNVIWQLTLAGTAHAAAGDTAVVRRLADSLEVLGPTSFYGGRDEKLHYVLRGLLLQREGRHAEAVDAFRRSLYSLTDGYTRTNLMMARSLIALHRPAEAIAVLQPAIRGGVDGSNTYVSRTELHEALAEAFEQAGRQDSATAHWRAVESAWRRADPQFQERYLTAKRKAGM
jgi:predicted Zn-dependent protease